MNNPIVNLVDGSFIFIIGISVFLLIGVTAAMIYFSIRYNEKNNPKADQSITGNTTLEVVWTIIPLFLVLGMFFYGWEGFKVMRDIPSDAMTVKVTGRMWAWSFEYETGKKSDTLLYLPHNKNIKFELMSADVNHSFYVPAYRVKEDCVPGRTNYMWFHTTAMGEFDILCAEYCGLNHAYMLGKVKVIPDDEFRKWVSAVDTVTTNTTGINSDTVSNKKSDTLK